MKKKPVSNTRTGKSNAVLRNFLTNLKENELHYENKQITQCVFLGVLRLKPVPSIFSSTNVSSHGASVVRNKPRKAKNNNNNKEVNKNVSKKSTINKVINGKITKKNTDKVRAFVKKSPAKKSKIIKIKLNINRTKSKSNMSNNNSEEFAIVSKNLSKLLPENPVTKQVVNLNSKSSTTFNPVDSLLNKLKQKIDVSGHSSGSSENVIIDSCRGTQTEFPTPVRRQLIQPTMSKLKNKSIHHQPFIMPLPSSNSVIISNENINKDKDDVIFVSDYKLKDPIVENINRSSDDIISIDSPKTGKLKERTSPRSKVSSVQDPGFNGQHIRNAITDSSHDIDIIIISDDAKSRPVTPKYDLNDLIIIDEPKEIRVSPRLKKCLDSNGNNSMTTMSSKNKIMVISDLDLNKPECSPDKCRNQQLNVTIDDNVIRTPVEKSTMQTVKDKKPDESFIQKTVDERTVQKPIEKPKQRRSRLMAAAIPSIFLNTPMLLRSELAQKKTVTDISKPKNREKSHPRLLRSELPKNSLLSKSFSEQKVVRQDKIEMRKCNSQENVFVPEESKTSYVNSKASSSQNSMEQKKRSSPQMKKTSLEISNDRWEITKSIPNMEIKNQEMMSNHKPVSLKLTLTKTSKTASTSPPSKEKSSRNQETQTERQEPVELPGSLPNVHKNIDKNLLYPHRLLRSDLNQNLPTLHNVAKSTENIEVIVIPDDNKINEMSVEILKDVASETAISPRLLRSNIPQQNIENGNDNRVAASNLLLQKIGEVRHPDEVILIRDEINSEQSKSNSMQNSNTNSVQLLISENTSKNIQSQVSVTNQQNSVLSESSTSVQKSKQWESQFQDSTDLITTPQSIVLPRNSTSPQRLRQCSNQSQETFISTSPQRSKHCSNQSQKTITLIPTHQSSMLPGNSTCQSEERATLICSTQPNSLSPRDSMSLQKSKQSSTQSQERATSITTQQPHKNSTSPQKSPKVSPIKSRILQKKAPINFDEIVVLNEKRSKKSKESTARLLRSDFHQPITTTKLSNVIEKEEVVVLIHDEPKSKSLSSPISSKIEVNSNISSEYHDNNIDTKKRLDMSPKDEPVLTQTNMLVQQSIIESKKMISEHERNTVGELPIKELAEAEKSSILENNMMGECKVENIETSPKPLKFNNGKTENVIDENVESMRPLQSLNDASVIELEEAVPPRTLRSQHCDKIEDVIEVKESPSQKSRSQRNNKFTTIAVEPLPQRILQCNKDEKVENVIAIAVPVRKKMLRSQNTESKVKTLSKLEEPLSQRTLRSQKREDIEIQNPLLTTTSKTCNDEKILQSVNDYKETVPKRILRSQKCDIIESKNPKKKERNKKSGKRTLRQNNAVRASKARIKRKLALRELRIKIIAKARECKIKMRAKSSKEKVIKEFKDITKLHTDKATILRGKKTVYKKTRANGSISRTVENKNNNRKDKVVKKLSDKIKPRHKRNKKEKCLLKFVPTKKVLRRKCKDSNRSETNIKPSLAVKFNGRVKRKMFSNTMKANLLKSQGVRKILVKQKQNKLTKTQSTHERKKVTSTSVNQKDPRKLPKNLIKNNTTSKLNLKPTEKTPNRNNLKNHKSVQNKVVKDNKLKNISKENVKKSPKNQKGIVDKNKTIKIENNDENVHKESKPIGEKEAIKKDRSVEENIVVDESITKTRSDNSTYKKVHPKRLRKTCSEVLDVAVPTVISESTVRSGEIQNKALPKRLRNSETGSEETSVKCPNSVSSSETVIEQASDITEIRTKCFDCNKTILLKLSSNQTNSIVDGSHPTVSKIDVMTEPEADIIDNSYKNKDITVFDFNETELEPVVPPMRFNSPKKDKNTKPIEEKYHKNNCRKVKLTELPTRDDNIRIGETTNVSQENAQGIPSTEEVPKKKLYSRIEKPGKSVGKAKNKTRTVIEADISAKEKSSNVKSKQSKERIYTKEKAPRTKSEPKLYSVIEKPSKKSSKSVEATNTSLGTNESSKQSQPINKLSAAPLAETSVVKNISTKKSPMKQATITDMFNKMKHKMEQSSTVRNVFSPTPKTVKSIFKDTPKDSQPSAMEMPPPKFEVPWSSTANAEDEDSDCESRMEWMPEEYAEYKFKYTAKKMSYKPIFRCKVCLLILPSYYMLNKHKLKHLKSDKPYKCQQCEEEFSNVVEYTAHIRVHKGKHPYTCKKCGEGFWKKTALEAHMPVHILKKMKQPEKKFRCDVCSKEFSKVCDIERHTRVHTGEKPCVCNICNKRFQQSNNLGKHLLIHLDIKPFHCEICNKQFRRVDILERHILIHSVEKPAKCQHCPKSFIRHSQLAVHIKKYHPNGAKNIKQERNSAN